MKIIINGPPIAKKRHKCGCRGGHPVAYDPQIKEDMDDIRKQMLSAWKEAHQSKNPEIVKEAFNLTKAQSFEVSYTFVFPTNKSETLAQKNAKLWGFLPHNTKPDLDNLEKLYSDCGSGIFWTDDSLISSCSSKKLYSENPRTEIEIMVKEDLKLNPNVEAILLVFGPDKLEEIQGYMREFDDDNINSRSYPEYLTKKAKILSEISTKFLNDLKKIQKIKIEDSNEQEVVQAIEEGRFNI